MDNAFDNENLDNQGQFNENVGQDNSETQNAETSTDWETQAKYFQSEKDKLHAENQKLKDYEKVGKLLESRPDIVQTISGMVQGGQPAATERIAMDKDEFDPWEAYNDPASKSYKFRQQELQDSINDAVQTQVAGVQKEVGMSKLQNELAAKGLTPDEINSFVNFASKNPAEYGVDGAINMWRAVTGEPAKDENGNPLDVVRQNQAVPQQAGILSGEQPVRKSDDEAVWEGILKAGSRANVL